MDICKLVGQNIRALRRKHRLSQEELAHRAGIDRSYLSEIENGLTNVSIVVLASLAPPLQIKVGDLFSGYR